MRIYAEFVGEYQYLVAFGRQKTQFFCFGLKKLKKRLKRIKKAPKKAKKLLNLVDFGLGI